MDPVGADGAPPRAGGVVAVAFAMAVLATAGSLGFVSPELPTDSDEGHHTVLALTYQRDVQHLDVRGFARHTLSTGRYPFLHGWYGAAATLVLGPSLDVLRATSSVLLGLAAALAVLLLRRIDPEIHPLWCVAAAVAIALAPENHANSVLCMLEVPGLALTLLGAWLYHRFLDPPESARRGFLAGLALAALLFVKYPYGAYLYVPVAIHEAWRVRFRLWRLFRVESLAVWLPFVVALGVWLAIPQSRAGVLKLLGDAPDEITREGGRDASAIPYVQPELVWFYVRTLTEQLSPGAILGWLLLFGNAVFLVSARSFGRVVVLGAIAWTIFTLTLSFRTFGVDRFLVPVGGLFVVAGFAGLARLWRTMFDRPGTVPLLARLALYGGLLAGVIGAVSESLDLPERAVAAVETTPEDAAMVRWIHEAVPGKGNLLLVGAWDQVCEDGVKTDFLLTRPEARISDLDVKAIRRERIYQGTGRLASWFDEESRWVPPGEETRGRYVLMLDASATHPSVDPEGFAAQWDEARRRLEGARRLDARSWDGGERFELYELTPADGD